MENILTKLLEITDKNNYIVINLGKVINENIFNKNIENCEIVLKNI